MVRGRRMRHAYLIIAHNNFPMLERQLRFLDSENADFFIHIDARVENFDFDHFRAVPKKSSVTFVKRQKISWGHHSMIWVELELLRAATAGKYDYYHLLSGVDAPLKTREYIEAYFERSPGTNYVHFQDEKISVSYDGRARFYYPFQRFNKRNFLPLILLRKLSTGTQLLLHMDRTRKYGADWVFQKGGQWFSITHELAAYVLENEKLIRRMFFQSFCGDEVFLQTLVINSPHFRATVPPGYFGHDYKNSLRYIDWQRGEPYTFRDEDLEELLHTGEDYLFARKFDYKNAPTVVDALFEHYSYS